MPEKKASRLTRARIDPSRLLREVADPRAGAVVLFLGTARNNSEAGGVEQLEYEAYWPMAERSLAQTEEDVLRRWPSATGVRILHRVGRLAPGDVSVAIAVSAPHRAEAFAACRHAIEEIKREAPIWKREKLTGGGEVWVEGVPVGREAARPSPGRGPKKKR